MVYPNKNCFIKTERDILNRDKIHKRCIKRYQSITGDVLLLGVEMATISKRRRNEGGTKLRSWLRFRYRSETNLLIPELVKIEAKRTLLILHLRKIEAERTLFIPEIGKIEAKKMNWIEVKRTEAIFLKLLWSPWGRNRFQGIDSASLCPGGPVQQPYSSSVPSPLRLF